MPLAHIYARAARPAAAGILVLVAAAVVAGTLGNALPSDGGQATLVVSGWALCAAAVCLVTASTGPRARAVLWVSALLGPAVAHGGLQAPAFARLLTLLLSLLAFCMAVLATLVSAGDDVRTASH